MGGIFARVLVGRDRDERKVPFASRREHGENAEGGVEQEPAHPLPSGRVSNQQYRVTKVVLYAGAWALSK